MSEKLITEAQRIKLREAALHRVAYVKWLADKIEKSSDEMLRREAAKVLRQLVS